MVLIINHLKCYPAARSREIERSRVITAARSASTQSRINSQNFTISRRKGRLYKIQRWIVRIAIK
jgi:hypothetical protein